MASSCDVCWESLLRLNVLLSSCVFCLILIVLRMRAATLLFFNVWSSLSVVLSLKNIVYGVVVLRSMGKFCIGPLNEN